MTKIVNGAYVTLRVQDMARAYAFYREGLGLEERFQTPAFSEVAAGGTVIALQAGGDGTYRGSSLSFDVLDIDVAIAAVTAAGGSVRREPSHVSGDLWIAAVVDPEGNGIGLSAHQNRPTPEAQEAK